MKINSFAYGWRVGLWTVIFGMGIALCLHGNFFSLLLGTLLIGLNIAHGLHLQHQAAHNTGFRSALANEIWGVLLGIPGLVSFYEYRIAHLFHHAKLGKAEHENVYDFGPDGRRTKRQQHLLAHYCQLFVPHLWSVLRRQNIVHHVYRYTERQQRKFKIFYLAAFTGILMLLGTSFWSGTLTPFLVWLFALIFVAIPVHGIFELPEHIGCNRFTTDLSTNTRSIRSNPLMHWFAHYNNFHAEHHWQPNLPFHVLPQLQRTPLHTVLAHHSSGYVAFYLEYLTQIRPRLRRRRSKRT